MDKLSQIEIRLRHQFRGFGYSDSVADAIASSFTQYMLGYLTADGCAKRLTDSGADFNLVLALVDAFRQLRRKSNIVAQIYT